MAKTYKIWIEIEEFDEETGEGKTLDAPDAAIVSFDDYNDAYTFASRLQKLGYALAE